jgi:very-short-patch-repair endonuclease
VDSCKLLPRKEIEFLNQLEDALKPFDIKGERQYPILNYRIDYYIESLNIAIEYDENDHNHYSYDRHEGRQLEIEQELNCRFIRISDKNTDAYNIGYIIKMILES